MTTHLGSMPQIYIPTLHREMLGGPIPESVLLLDPGLPESENSAERFLPGNYPLSRNEAKKVLVELLSMGELLNLNSSQGGLHFTDMFPNDSPAGNHIFTKSLFSEKKTDENKIRTSAIAAQKVLLLAWDLEQRLLELSKIRQEAVQAAMPLAREFRGHDAMGEMATLTALFPESFPEFIPPLSIDAEPDWRLTLAAMAVFLPANALLITAHMDLRQTLLELGMLLPLAQDTAQALVGWDESLKSSLLWTKVPLWRILGHTKAPEKSPWLLASPEIIVCPTRVS